LDENQYYYSLLLRSLVENPLFQNSVRETLIWEYGKINKIDDLKKNYYLHYDCHRHIDIYAFENFPNAVSVKDSLTKKTLYLKGKISPRTFDRGVISCLIWEFLETVWEFKEEMLDDELSYEVYKDNDEFARFQTLDKMKRDNMSLALKQLKKFVNHDPWWKVCLMFINSDF
jgi:hypothetical protein